MFRFWSSDSRGCETTDEPNVSLPAPPGSSLAAVPDSFAMSHPILDRPPKRRLSDTSDDLAYQCASGERPLSKRARVQDIALLSPQSLSTDCREEDVLCPSPRDPLVTCDYEDAKEVIQYQFGLEILLKHDELRLIDQELAKCQVALEQLRRCHLIPYPVHCPTPAQMLDISSGKGLAFQGQPGDPVPRWAPPFGVVDGPYARHYARWLIPDPMFDGMQPEPQSLPHASRGRFSFAEGSRTTRNSLADVSSSGKGRPVRGMGGQKLHALSSGYAQPKDKHAPCILKRSDGKTVKLICIDCQRWDFSSTQGFINHCRIAHRRDFKSHEEAAVHCGHPIEVDEAGGIVGDEKPAVASSTSALVHSFARSEPITDQQAYTALRSRISASLKLYHAGKLPDVKLIPGIMSKVSAQPGSKKSTPFVGAAATPYLSQLLQKKDFNGDLGQHVSDAKIKMDLDEAFASSEDSEDPDNSTSNIDTASAFVKSQANAAARTPAVMRVPARTVVSPVPLPAIPRPTSSKGHAAQLPFSAISETPENDADSPSYDVEMDIDLSPNTMTSNNAPSLVSDDGEYDDSDDGSSSETSDSIGQESVSDVAEINIDEENEIQDRDSPRPIRHHRGNPTSGKDENKHVTFVTPITGNTGKAKGRRNAKV